MATQAASEKNTSPPPPHVPTPDGPKLVSFSSSDVPIQAATVFCKNKAEVTRVINISSPSRRGRHEVELADLPGRSLIDGTSVRVKGSGHCTILHVSYSDEPKEAIEPEATQEERDAAKARREKLKEDIQRLTDELTALNQQSARTRLMRGYADRFAERTVVTTAGGSANAAVAMRAPDNGSPLGVDDVGKALDWWAARAAQTDAEVHRLELEGRTLKKAIAELVKARDAPSSSAKPQDRHTACSLAALSGRKGGQSPKPLGRILVTVDVQEIGGIELEVKYMTKGATWSPSYDLRVDTQTDSVSCTYYGIVSQSTDEDWKGVALRLSTAEPTVHGTPPTLASKLVSLKRERITVTCQAPKSKVHRRKTESGHVNWKSSSTDDDESEESDSQPLSQQQQHFSMMGKGGGSGRGGGRGRGGGGHIMRSAAFIPRAPPPPPQAKASVALVEGGGGGIGAVSFVVETPGDIKSNGQTKKMTVGVLQLSAEVTHYIVPAKDPAAYLQAKATNNTEYLLLASDDVSIFFDNSFVTKTSLTSVSPGESFQTFLGIDPAVKITVAPVRKTTKQRGIFSKSNQVTHIHSTSISNKKKVPVTCVVVDAMPRSTNDIIKVTLKQPVPGVVAESEAINDDMLASTALELFGGGSGGGEGEVTGGQATHSRTRTVVAGVMKSPSNHLAWVGKIAPQSEISIPLEYSMEWPSGKEIEIYE